LSLYFLLYLLHRSGNLDGWGEWVGGEFISFEFYFLYCPFLHSTFTLLYLAGGYVVMVTGRYSGWLGTADESG